MASKSIEFDAVVSANQINRLLSDLRSGAEGAAKAINDALGGTVTKKIVFEEVVNSDGIKQLVAVEKQRLSVADQLISKQSQLNKTQAGSKTNLQQLLNNLKQQRDGVARYETSINAVGASIRRQRAEWTALNAQVSAVQRQLDVAAASGFWQRLKVETRTQGLINIGNGLVEITNQLQAASIIIGQFTGAINTLIDSAAQIQSFSLAFQAIGAGGAGAAKALQESSRIALGLGVDLNTVQEGFKQLSPVVLNIGGTLGDVSGVVESLSSRFAAFGISGDRARRVTQGVIQAFAKGKLQAEELTQQISEADPAFKTDFAGALFAARGELGALGKQIDGSTANLEKLVKAGKITADVLLKVLPGISKSSFLFGKLGPTAGTAVDALEKGSVTIDQVRSNLKNLSQLSLRNIAQSAEPLINAFLRIQAVVVDFFSRISKSSAFESFAGVAARVVEALARLADTFFIVVEGALRVAEAIKPILDLLANVPGLAELAGVALLGKLLKPFKLFEGQIGRAEAAWGNFINAISGGPREAARSVANSVKQFQTELLKPASIRIDSKGIQQDLAAVGSAVGSTVTSTATRTVNEIDKKIEQSLRAQSRIREQITSISPTRGLAQSEAVNRELKALREQSKELSKQRNEIKRLIAEKGRLAPAPGGGATTLAEALRANTRAARILDNTQAELLRSRQALSSTPTFTKAEEQRIARLNSQLQTSLGVTTALREERAKAEQAATAARRQQIGFEPGAISQLQKFIDLRKEEIKTSALAESTRFSELNNREKEIRSRLAAIKQERQSLVRGFPGIRIPANEFRTEEVTRLTQELRGLKEERGQLVSQVSRFAASETNIARILKEGSAESATFAQRQKAISTLLDLNGTEIRQNAKDIKALNRRYRELNAERKNLLKQQGARPFKGPVPANDPLLTSLALNRQKQEETRKSIARLRAESIAAIRAQRQYSEALKANALSANTLGAAFLRSTGNIGRFAGGIAGLAGGALASLRAGIAGLLEALGPITAIFLTVGVASRLYADGNADAAAKADEYKQRLQNLNSVLKELDPSLEAVKTKSTVLGKAWEALAVSAVKVGNAISSAFEKAATVVGEFFNRFKTDATGIDPLIANIIGSIGLVAGLGTLGAAIGSAILPGLGTVVGGVIGGLAGVIASLGIGSDEAAIKVEKLKGELEALRGGSTTATEAAKTLADKITEISKSGGKEIPSDTYNTLKTGLGQLRDTARKTQIELDGLKAARKIKFGDVEKTKNEIQGLEEALEKAKQRFEDAKKLPSQVGIGPLGIPILRPNPELAAASKEVQDIEAKIRKLKEQSTASSVANKDLGNTIEQLEKDLKNQKDAVAQGEKALRRADATNRNYIDTINEINEEIKRLNQENEGLKLSDPTQREQLDFNLEQVKSLQRILQEVSKTKYEITIEVRNLRGTVAEAQTRIDIEPGDLRDTVILARKTSDEIANAQDEFKRSADDYATAIAKGMLSQEEGAAATERAALKFLEATRKGAAELIDQGRALADKLSDSQKSLTNLKLSNPGFFTPEEIRANAQQIEEDFLKAVEKVRQETGNLGFFPRLEGGTPQEILEQKQRFVETRAEAERLTESINEINGSLSKIIVQLSKISGIEIESIKGGASAVNELINQSRTSIEKLGGSVVKIKRVGEVVGTLSGGGNELVLYYDNVTKQVEQVTAAQFKALEAADKLATGGTKVGTGFVAGAKTAVDSVKAIGDRVGEVYGVISAAGQTEVTYFDKLTGQVETVSKAVFDRLSIEKAVTGETEKQGNALDRQIEKFQTIDAQVADLISKRNFAARNTAGETRGSFVFFPSNMMSEDESNRRIAELAKKLGGNYLRVLSETIRTDGEGLGFMPIAKLEAIARETSGYRTALQNVRLAQEQADAAQKRYNDGVSSGSGDIIALGAAVRNANEALSQSKLELASAEAGFRAASTLAAQLGIDVASIPSVGQFLPAPEELGNALQQWNDYVNGVSTGSQQLQTSSNAVQQQWNDYVNSVTSGTQQITQQASVDTFSPLVEAARGATVRGGEVLQKWGAYIQEIQSGIRSIGASSAGNPLSGLTDGANTANQALQGATGSSEVISSNFANTASRANEIRDSLLELNGRTIEIFVKQTPLANPRFAGGPVVGGQEYQVNELGQEGFLSAAGKLSNISAPAYGLWRAPGAGTVIPAHIMDKLSIPQSGIKVNTGGKSVTSNNGMQQIMRTIFAAMSTSRTPEAAINELASVQANQAIQIGKLSRVVNKLAEKDWNVNVSVRPSSSASYIDRLNHRL